MLSVRRQRENRPQSFRRRRRSLNQFSFLLLSFNTKLVSSLLPSSPLAGIDRVVVLDLGENLGPLVQQRIAAHLEPWLRRVPSGEKHDAELVEGLVDAIVNKAPCPGSAAAASSSGMPLLLLSLGNTAASRRLLSDVDPTKTAAAEGFVLSTFAASSCAAAVAADGNPMREDTPHSRWDSAADRLAEVALPFQVSTGAVTAAYAALEALGFAFLHPLAPVQPLRLRPLVATTRRAESPHWPIRGFHVHTQHPLELTDVLQGFDIAAGGRDNAGDATSGRSESGGSRGGSVSSSSRDGTGKGSADGKSGGGGGGENDIRTGQNHRAAGTANSVFWLQGTPSTSDEDRGSAASGAAAGSRADAEDSVRGLRGSGDGGGHGDGASDWSQHEMARNDTVATGGGGGAGSGNASNGAYYSESWESMLDDVEAFFEWCAVNRVNRVEWMLLGDSRWGEAAASPLRQVRLRRLIGIAHGFGVLAGADVPLALRQQHAWYMVRTGDAPDVQQRAIQNRCNWVADAGFDFISTEAGLSEFHAPGDAVMLRLMNDFALHVNGTLGLPASIKVHCSTEQLCDAHDDPRYADKAERRPLNFNYLPTFAVPELGVMPHTVQAYGLDDPTANVYGNADFGETLEYALWEARQGRRSVVYYGETAYWVSVDVDVPLFLPVYGERRLHDLRLIAAREDSDGAGEAKEGGGSTGGARIDGQMNFDSGWEWGFWLNDVITARAAWNPRTDAGDDAAALIALIGPVLAAAFGEETGGALADWLARLCTTQRNLLLLGRIDDDNSGGGGDSGGGSDGGGDDGGGERTAAGVAAAAAAAPGNGGGRPAATADPKLTGIAYLSGGDTWLDLPRLLGVSMTQPDKVRFHETRDPRYGRVTPLLVATEVALTVHARELDAIVAGYAAASAAASTTAGSGGGSGGDSGGAGEGNGHSTGLDLLLRELQDAMAMTVLRARHVRLLYSATGPSDGHRRGELLAEARTAIGEAAAVVARRETHYRVPAERVAGWRDGPTAYRYGYLWAVRSLYFWWRDQGLAERIADPRTDFCYLNRMDPAEIGFGWGKHTFQALRATLSAATSLQADSFVNCLAAPPEEYQFPRDLDRYSFNLI